MSVLRLSFFALILLIIFISARLLPNMGVFRSLEPVNYGSCEIIPGPIGPEDITIDHKRKMAFISADDRRQYIQSGDFGGSDNGIIWTLDLSNPDAKPVPMTHDLAGPFHPHGIALYDEEAYELYVVNHLSMYEHEVNVFEIVSNTELKLKERITYPELIAPNDLIVLGQNQFLVSNDHGHPRGTVWEKIEVFLTLPWSSVSYYDGKQGHIVIDGLRMANGLALNKDKSMLYLAESTRGTLSRYQRGESALTWQYLDEIDIDSAIDNLEWYGEDTILTGAHPKSLDFLKHVFDASHPSPSEVVAINVGGETMSSEIWHLDDGTHTSGSSVAARYQDDLFIGVVFEEHLTRCRPNTN